MLAKLLKYEFKATGRRLLPAYGLLLVLSLLMRMSELDQLPWGSWWGVVQGLITLLYGFVFGAAMVLTVLLLVQRFYKNLLRDEGYLMNTLPVAPWQNVAAKLIAACVWSLLSLGVAFLSVLLLGMDWLDWQEFFSEFGRLMSVMNAEYGANVPLFAIEGLICVLAALAQSIVSVYLALAIGHMANKAKILWSVAAYLGISVVEYLGAMLLARLDSLTHLSDWVLQVLWRNSEVLVAHGLVDSFSLVNLLLGGVMFGITCYILRCKLNLE